MSRLVTLVAITLVVGLAVSFATVGARDAGAAPATFKIDTSHSAVLFKANHLGVSYTWGRFNSFEGSFTLTDGDAKDCAVEVSVDASSVDTGNQGRDDHLRNADFFNVKEFPTISFKSTKVVRVDGGFDVTGDLTLHGVTKPVTARMLKVGEGDLTEVMPQLGYRAGFEGKFTVKLADHGFPQKGPKTDDSVMILMSFEGVRQ